MKYVNMQYDYVSQKEKGYKHNLNKKETIELCSGNNSMFMVNWKVMTLQ